MNQETLKLFEVDRISAMLFYKTDGAGRMTLHAEMPTTSGVIPTLTDLFVNADVEDFSKHAGYGVKHGIVHFTNTLRNMIAFTSRRSVANVIFMHPDLYRSWMKHVLAFKVSMHDLHVIITDEVPSNEMWAMYTRNVRASTMNKIGHCDGPLQIVGDVAYANPNWQSYCRRGII